MSLMLALGCMVGAWNYSGFQADPPAALSIQPIRSAGGAGPGTVSSVPVPPPPAPADSIPEAPPVDILPPAADPPVPPASPATGKATSPCSCGGAGCPCKAGAVCTVIDGACEPGLRQVPAAEPAPMTDALRQKIKLMPPVITPSQGAPPPASWRMRDSAGNWFTHADKVYLESWMRSRNAALTQTVYTPFQLDSAAPSAQTSPPAYQYATPPSYAPFYGGMFSGFRGSFGGGCAGGNCR